MKAADDGLPIVGDQAKELGVRVPPNPHADIDVDLKTNLVVWNGKGMSVGANWRDLPTFLIPKRLSAIAPDAAGSNSLICYRFGTGEFVEGNLATGLELIMKPGETNLGLVVPTSAVTITEFQQALAATRPDWKVDET